MRAAGPVRVERVAERAAARDRAGRPSPSPIRWRCRTDRRGRARRPSACRPACVVPLALPACHVIASRARGDAFGPAASSAARTHSASVGSRYVLPVFCRQPLAEFLGRVPRDADDREAVVAPVVVGSAIRLRGGRRMTASAALRRDPPRYDVVHVPGHFGSPYQERADPDRAAVDGRRALRHRHHLELHEGVRDRLGIGLSWRGSLIRPGTCGDDEGSTGDRGSGGEDEADEVQGHGHGAPLLCPGPQAFTARATPAAGRTARLLAGRRRRVRDRSDAPSRGTDRDSCSPSIHRPTDDQVVLPIEIDNIHSVALERNGGRRRRREWERALGAVRTFARECSETSCRSRRSGSPGPAFWPWRSTSRR